MRLDDITVKTDPNGGTSFTDTQFTEDGSTSAVSVTHDKAGNMTCDGLHEDVPSVVEGR
jgi:hypothetical protein